MMNWRYPIAMMLHRQARRVLSAGVLALALAPPPAAAQDNPVLTYHADIRRDGNFVAPGLTWEKAGTLHPVAGFHASFSGHVYAQPLYWKDPQSGAALLIVATEDDSVVALDAATGKTVWTHTLGRPASRGSLRCGNIDPLGITGTPVIDAASKTVYLDAVVDGGSGPLHLVFALSLGDGATVAGWPVDVGAALRGSGQDFNAPDQNERGALTILDGKVFVPFGGHFGDCGNYRGWVVGIALGDPKAVTAWATRARGGGIWAPGGIASDGTSLFVATGNTMGAGGWQDGEAVIRLAPDLHRSERNADFFAPSDWRELDDSDADLGGTNPLLIYAGSDQLALALGKDRRAYLLDEGNLGGIGGSLAAETVASGAIRTAPAAYPAPDGAFVAFEGEGANCPGNSGDLTVLRIRAASSPAISTAWCGAVRGRGSPIVTTTDRRSDPIVWMVGAEGDDRLHGFRGDTGAPVFTGGEAMEGMRHFGTLIAAGGRLYVAGDGRVYAWEP
jgi:hypothetical protein